MLVKELTRIFGFLNRKENIHPELIINDMPYFSQWESSALVGKIIREEISAREDPLWRESGAESPKEYEFWARNMCGMACLKMIIKHKFGRNIPIITLGKKCAEFGGYIEKVDTIDGLYYSPFLKFINQEFDLEGRTVGHMSLDRIIKEISQGHYVIASVSHKIRNPDSKPATKGGHLILVLGYDLERKTIVFHNPSGDTTKNQEYSEISFPQFEKFFARRSILIKK